MKKEIIFIFNAFYFINSFSVKQKSSFPKKNNQSTSNFNSNNSKINTVKESPVNNSSQNSINNQQTQIYSFDLAAIQNETVLYICKIIENVTVKYILIRTTIDSQKSNDEKIIKDKLNETIFKGIFDGSKNLEKDIAQQSDSIKIKGRFIQFCEDTIGVISQSSNPELSKGEYIKNLNSLKDLLTQNEDIKASIQTKNFEKILDGILSISSESQVSSENGLKSSCIMAIEEILSIKNLNSSVINKLNSIQNSIMNEIDTSQYSNYANQINKIILSLNPPRADLLIKNSDPEFLDKKNNMLKIVSQMNISKNEKINITNKINLALSIDDLNKIKLDETKNIAIESKNDEKILKTAMLEIVSFNGLISLLNDAYQSKKPIFLFIYKGDQLSANIVTQLYSYLMEAVYEIALTKSKDSFIIASLNTSTKWVNGDDPKIFIDIMRLSDSAYDISLLYNQKIKLDRILANTDDLINALKSNLFNPVLKKDDFKIDFKNKILIPDAVSKLEPEGYNIKLFKDVIIKNLN